MELSQPSMHEVISENDFLALKIIPLWQIPIRILHHWIVFRIAYKVFLHLLVVINRWNNYFLSILTYTCWLAFNLIIVRLTRLFAFIIILIDLARFSGLLVLLLILLDLFLLPYSASLILRNYFHILFQLFYL